MNKKRLFQQILICLAIFSLPFLEFLNNNINEIDIILVGSFYLLIIFTLTLIIIISTLLNFLIKKKNFFESLLFVLISYWLLFKHNFTSLLIKDFFRNLNSKEFLLSAEISLGIIFIIIILSSILIFRKNIFFIRFVSIFFVLSFIVNFYQLITYEKTLTKLNQKSLKNSNILYEDNLNKKKKNIYFFILDGMQPIDEFETYNNLNFDNFLSFAKEKGYEYQFNTNNLYDNTIHSLSAIFYLKDIFEKNGKLKTNTNILYPTLLRKNNQSTLINNLEYLNYEFKWIGNYFAYCPKFNLKYCLNQNQNSYFDTYLYINFFRQTPLIQIITKLGHQLNFDFDKYIFFDLHNGIGRLQNYLENNHNNLNPMFYFIHHMSPHWPYLTDSDCSYAKFPGERNYEGYRASYQCVINRVKDIIVFLSYNDPDATIIFQSDHNWPMSKNKTEKKKIFNLFKIDKNCHQSYQNLNNVNMLRLIFSCMTGNEVNFIN